MSERLLLNVGGKRFETTRATILLHQQGLLARMFSAENSSILKADKDGSYFFDRDGDMFQHVLNFYRTGIVACFESLSMMELLKEEFTFWGLPLDMPLDVETKSKLVQTLNICDANQDRLVQFDLLEENAFVFIESLCLMERFVSNMRFKIDDKEGFYVSIFDDTNTAYLNVSFPVKFFENFKCKRVVESSITLHDTFEYNLFEIMKKFNRKGQRFVLRVAINDQCSRFCMYLCSVDPLQLNHTPSILQISCETLYDSPGERKREVLPFSSLAVLKQKKVMHTNDLKQFLEQLFDFGDNGRGNRENTWLNIEEVDELQWWTVGYCWGGNSIYQSLPIQNVSVVGETSENEGKHAFLAKKEEPKVVKQLYLKGKYLYSWMKYIPSGSKETEVVTCKSQPFYLKTHLPNNAYIEIVISGAKAE